MENKPAPGIPSTYSRRVLHFGDLELFFHGEAVQEVSTEHQRVSRREDGVNPACGHQGVRVTGEPHRPRARRRKRPVNELPSADTELDAFGSGFEFLKRS